MQHTTIPKQKDVNSAEKKDNLVPEADVISLETVVNMLVQKGICTTNELFMLEGKVQKKNEELNKNNYVAIKNKSSQVRFHWLKRKMGKRRWTRRLGTALFGWQWKKVKKANIV